MNEKYLHLIWKSKRLPFHQIKTICGKEINLLNVGTYNLASGPDFFNGQFEIDAVKYSGNIELHVKSSDWYAHGHQFDEAYNNVILHVVFEYDKEVYINNQSILTIELKNHIDWNHFKSINTDVHFNTSIPCANSLDLATPIQIWSQFQTALSNRINRKVNDLEILFSQQKDLKKVFFIKVAQTMGMKVNALPFEELAMSIPLTKWLNMNLVDKTVVCFGVSGLSNYLTDKAKFEWTYLQHKFNLKEVNSITWKFKGVRPAGYPPNRIAQFVLFCHLFRWDFSIFKTNAQEIKASTCSIIKSQKEQLFEFEKIFIETLNWEIKKEILDLILLNVFAPFSVFFQSVQGIEKSTESAIELLEKVKCEKNKLITFWKDLGVVFNSAADSQSALEQYNEYCMKKKCMECQISSVIFQQKL